MPAPWSFILVSAFVVDSSTVMQAVFVLMAVGGFGFLVAAREKKP